MNTVVILRTCRATCQCWRPEAWLQNGLTIPSNHSATDKSCFRRPSAARQPHADTPIPQKTRTGGFLPANSLLAFVRNDCYQSNRCEDSRIATPPFCFACSTPFREHNLTRQSTAACRHSLATAAASSSPNIDTNNERDGSNSSLLVYMDSRRMQHLNQQQQQQYWYCDRDHTEAVFQLHPADGATVGHSSSAWSPLSDRSGLQERWMAVESPASGSWTSARGHHDANVRSATGLSLQNGVTTMDYVCQKNNGSTRIPTCFV